MKAVVAAVQFAPIFGQKIENLRKLVALVTQAAAAGAKLVVLPELCAVGYSFMSAEQARPLAEPLAHFGAGEFEGGDSALVMANTARKLGVHIAWGLIEVDVGTGDLYNAQALVAPTGEMYSYRKVNRWGQDFCWSRPGRGNPPIATLNLGGVEKRVGLLICRDIRDRVNDKWTSLYDKGDADIVAFSANFGDGGFPATSWMEFVENNRATLIVSNRYGMEANNNFGEGGSCIIEPPDKVHCDGLVWNQDCIVLAEV